MPDVAETVDLDAGDKEDLSQSFLEDHSDPAGVPRPDIWRQAVADFYQLDLDASILWSQIGPAPLIVDADRLHMGIGPDSGEVTDILIDPSGTTDQTIFITTNDGGVWKTVDGGASWRPLTDQMFSISMGAIAMDPANPQILYAGSGNLFDGGGSFTKGAGIYRSADGGITWAIVDGGFFGTIFANVGVNRIVCPTADCLLVATNQGLYRSVDGGRNFGANTPDFNDRQPVVPGKICSLLLDSATPASTVYCGVAGDSTDASGNPLPNVGLLKSTNAGITFPTNLFNGGNAPSLPYSAFAAAQSAFDRTTSNSAVFYVSVQLHHADGSNTFVGLYRSDDSGATWNGPLVSLANVAGANGFGQTDYDLTLGVDPVNPRRVYAGFQQVWLSIDSGQSFRPTAVTENQVHWDNHAIAFSPATHRAAPPATGDIPATTVYTGTDGGIARSNDGGQAWSCINSGIATNLFRGIDIGKGGTDTGNGVPNLYTYGGCQDTGTSGHRPGDTFGEWHAGINGDGWLVAVDSTDPRVVYGFDGVFFIKSTNKGATWSATFNNPVTVGLGLSNAPPSSQRAIALDLVGTNPATRTVYVSECRKLLKSTDAGVHFAATPLAPSGAITWIATTPTTAGVLWVGCSDGTVQFSNDNCLTWHAFSPGGVAVVVGPVSGIAIDPANTQRVAVVYGGVSGIHAKYKTRHVFLTLDGGANWADVSGTDGSGPVGNVPDLPLHSVVFDRSASPSAIVIAGDAGVLRTTNAAITDSVGSATWKIYGAGLPMACCNSLAIDNSVTPPVLRVGTYGRSCFEASRPAGPAFASDDNLAFGTVASGQSVTLTCYVYNAGGAALDISAASVISTDPFTLGATPSLPLSVAPGATQTFQVTFAPIAATEAFGLLSLTTNDPTIATRFIPLSGTGVSTGLVQRLAVNPIATAGFGTVAIGSNRSIPVQLFNVGTAPLTVSAIARSSGSADFSLNPAPTFPIVLAPGGESDIAIQFAPAGAGAVNAEFTISSDDPHSPVKLTASGTGNLPTAGFWAELLRLLGIAHP